MQFTFALPTALLATAQRSGTSSAYRRSKCCKTLPVLPFHWTRGSIDRGQLGLTLASCTALPVPITSPPVYRLELQMPLPAVTRGPPYSC
ncbi:hypothetical protein L208DRAFT_1406908 [Tricholoma matsutake]|nr:hypothetical protein L208DRAFT_1406908 [Tricholoma matsutake 945]